MLHTFPFLDLSKLSSTLGSISLSRSATRAFNSRFSCVSCWTCNENTTGNHNAVYYVTSCNDYVQWWPWHIVLMLKPWPVIRLILWWLLDLLWWLLDLLWWLHDLLWWLLDLLKWLWPTMMTTWPTKMTTWPTMMTIWPTKMTWPIFLSDLFWWLIYWVTHCEDHYLLWWLFDLLWWLLDRNIMDIFVFLFK